MELPSKRITLPLSIFTTKTRCMERKMVASGNVSIRERSFHYEFWSNNEEVTVKIYHHGRKGDVTQFCRHDRHSLKKEMEDALINDGVFKPN
jgi:hypothetical protein